MPFESSFRPDGCRLTSVTFARLLCMFGIAGLVALPTAGKAAGSSSASTAMASGLLPNSAAELLALSALDVAVPAPPTNLSWAHQDMTVTLSWDPSQGATAGSVFYDLYYGSFWLASFEETTAALIGFQVSTPYTFTVKARDAAGNSSVASNAITVLLSPGQDTIPPSAPTNVGSTSVTTTSVRLSWTASTDNVGVVVYEVLQGGSAVANAIGTTSANVSGLTPGTMYSFTVRARDAAGNASPASSALWVTTPLPLDTAPPSTPAGLTVTAATSSSVSLAWSPSIDDFGVVGYDVLNGSAVVLSVTSTAATLTGLSPGTYIFSVRARDAAGNLSATSASVSGTVAADTHWVGTWATGPQLTETANNPPVSLTNATLRQVVHVSIGGSRLRVKLSNAYGNGPVEIKSAHLARTSGSSPGSSIVSGTDKTLTFGGSSSVTIAAGNTATSDAVELTVAEATNLTISLAFGSTPSGITGHPGSRTTSYIVSGNVAGSTTLSSPSTTDHWYYIQSVDVMAPVTSHAIAILGDSITDGRGSTTNGNDRWPDDLALRLLANDATQEVAVLNLGIGGNTILSGGLGPTAMARFDADILGQAGVKWVVVLEGVNDIGNASSAQVATDLISAYQSFISRAHAAGLRIYGATILPFNGHSYYTAAHETARQTVNNWIRTSGSFDAVIDLDAAVRDPSKTDTLRSSYDSGDHLHLNQAGYQAMANAISLALFGQ
jgi:lysophospholipase L1-like esterase/chitodextrinase